MIDALRVENLALIRDVSIEPAAGLTVLTGETGAGKTALLSAVKLVVGERATSDLIREGADELSIEARFFKGVDECIVRRRLDSDGRGRVEIDGHMASVRELAESVGASVDLCGQHEHQRLLSPAAHLELLDAWGKEQCSDARERYQKAFDAQVAAADELARLEALDANESTALAEAEFMLKAIDVLAPYEGELEELEAKLPVAEHAEALLRAAEAARGTLAEDEGVLDKLSSAASELESASVHDEKLARLSERLQGQIAELDDLSLQLRAYRDGIDLDPESLAQMQERHASLQGLMRSYGPSMADVLRRREEAAALVSSMENKSELLAQARATLARAEEELLIAGCALDEARQAAAGPLCEEICTHLERLNMKEAGLEFERQELERDKWKRLGPSRYELMYKPAKELPAKPFKKIASGGELSRVMLAIKLVLGSLDEVETLVFDEVDAGVGGETAVALAQVIADLAKSHQVIVVTHLAQLAVYADKHYMVEKRFIEQPESVIFELTGEDRVREIARMLSGDASELALAHAREMLQV